MDSPSTETAKVVEHVKVIWALQRNGPSGRAAGPETSKQLWSMPSFPLERSIVQGGVEGSTPPLFPGVNRESEAGSRSMPFWQRSIPWDP